VPGQSYADIPFDVDSMTALLANERESRAFQRPRGLSGFDWSKLWHPGARPRPGPGR
jgi:hypothetical protein